MAQSPTHPLIGRPVVFTKDAKKRHIGVVIDVDVVGGDLNVTTRITDPAVANMLGIEVPADLKGVLPDGSTST